MLSALSAVRCSGGVISEVQQDWLERAAGGDNRAFRKLFDEHAPAIHRFARSLVQDGAAADEVAQETFVRAHSRLATVKEPERFRSWLFGIARRVALESRRRAGRAAPEDSSPYIETVSHSPEQLLLSAEADAALSDALGRLSEDRRAALLLRLDHGLGYDEIADSMGWSVAKVKNEIHRGRLELRQELSTYMRGES